MDGLNRLLAAVGGAKEMPKPVPRPQPRLRKASSSLDMAKVAYLQEIRDRHARESAGA